MDHAKLNILNSVAASESEETLTGEIFDQIEKSTNDKKSFHDVKHSSSVIAANSFLSSSTSRPTSRSRMQLPHAPGTIPNYLRRLKETAVKKEEMAARDRITEAQILTLQEANHKLQKTIDSMNHDKHEMTAELQLMKMELDLKTQLLKKKSNEACKKDEKSLNLDEELQISCSLESQSGKQDLEITSRKNNSEDMTLLTPKKIIDSKHAEVEVVDLKREIAQLKSIERIVHLKLSATNSKLADVRSKHIRTENILLLRGQYIKTLQDNEDVHKKQLLSKEKDVKELREKLSTAKKKKSVSCDELNKVHEDLARMKNELKQKDDKITKYKSKLDKIKAREFESYF